MATRRERLEAKLEKREAWAEGRAAKSEAAWSRGTELANQLTPGQPILVGHHSERRHRAHIEKMHGAMSRAVEHGKMAEHHASKAAGLAAQLEGSIYEDDPNAVEALEQRVAELEAERASRKAVNAAWRKAGKPKVQAASSEPAALAAHMKAWQAIGAAGGLGEQELLALIRRMAHSWHPAPYPPYSMTNLGARIREAQNRIGLVKQRQERTAAAEAAPNGVTIEGDEYVRVTYAEKPPREVINALKAAGYHWSRGSWVGQRAKLPAVVSA